MVLLDFVSALLSILNAPLRAPSMQARHTPCTLFKSLLLTLQYTLHREGCALVASASDPA